MRARVQVHVCADLSSCVYVHAHACACAYDHSTVRAFAGAQARMHTRTGMRTMRGCVYAYRRVYVCIRVCIRVYVRVRGDIFWGHLS